MPQLSPLNWIFLFVLFWAAVLSVSILIWWWKKTLFQAHGLDSLSKAEKTWNW
uniref:ATP synthase F0 subunit 8 n=1 Tax=Sydaphera spengleriana TaxID=1088891 RepID=A0A8K1RRM0_9CAEN|nr:ATP synthase F0 subunit 8 [Sydaphera spengleriana]